MPQSDRWTKSRASDMNEKVIQSPFESLVQRTVTTSVFPTFLLSLITFPLLFTCISIYPINTLLSPVLSPVFTNCTLASNWLFRHLCTNTPLPCLVCWFLQSGRRYVQNTVECFEWWGLRGMYSLSFLRWLLIVHEVEFKTSISFVNILDQVSRCSTKQPPTHDTHLTILHIARHPSLVHSDTISTVVLYRFVLAAPHYLRTWPTLF